MILLELSKIENEGFHLSIQSMNMIDCFNEVIKMMEGKATEKEITFIFEEHPDEMMLEGDVYRLKQVFLNIISNALTYTPNNGEVRIMVEEYCR